MLSEIKNLIAGATSFLRTGEAPPNTPSRILERMQDINHLSSKKFFIVFTSLMVLASFYYTSVGILLLMPATPEMIVAYTTFFSKTMEILAVIIAAYIGCQSVVDLKYSSSSSSSLTGNTQYIKEEIKEEYVSLITTNAKEEDYELK